MELALFLHVLGAILFGSGVIVAGIAHEAARRRYVPGEIALLLGSARFGVLLVGIGGLLLLGSGLWLVEASGAGFGARWVQAALGLFLLAAVLGAAGGRRPKQARLLAARLAREGKPTGPELRRLLGDPVSLLLNYVSAALVVAILVLMIWKPT